MRLCELTAGIDPACFFAPCEGFITLTTSCSVAMKKASDSTKVTIHQRYAPGITPNALPLNPINMGDRATSLSDNYANFRLVSFRFRLHPVSAFVSCGYATGSANTTPPSTAQTIMELVPSTYILSAQTCPTGWVVVPKGDLAGPMPWYKTQTTTGNDEFPGALVTTNAGADVEYYAVLEFKGGIDPANTPAWQEYRRKYREEVSSRLVAAERDRIVAILAMKGSTAAKPTPGDVPGAPK